MPDNEQGNVQQDADPREAPLHYNPPVLRSHGSLRDLTAAVSGLGKSDVNLKENIVPVVWG